MNLTLVAAICGHKYLDRCIYIYRVNNEASSKEYVLRIVTKMLLLLLCDTSSPVEAGVVHKAAVGVDGLRGQVVPLP